MPTDSVAGDETLQGEESSPTVGEQGVGEAGDELARGAEIGRYVVLGKIGAGGMGVVYAAFDPELDRKVAIKVLRRGRHDSASRSDGAARLAREARSLARLSHPNVIAVHDVGTLDGRVWLAMEFVEGHTLGTWLAAAARSWREVVAVMLAAGRGLEAAHAAGLLHRDFKPDNVMVGNDGRVRVMDFGLARSQASAVRDSGSGSAAAMAMEPELAALSTKITHAGALIGTPRYMAPEQFLASEVGAAADQFSFAVTLWEGLYGQRPFAGKTVFELAARVLSGRPPVAAKGKDVPIWLRKICEVGLAPQPERRFPSLTVMLAEIERGQARARNRVASIAAVLVVALAAGAFGARGWEHRRRVAACDEEGASIERLWNEGERDRLRAGLLASGATYAESVPATVLPWLDARAQEWQSVTTEVCKHESVDADWEAATVDRARWCLEDRRLELAALVAALAEADGGTAQRAVASAAALGPAAPCADPRQLDLAPEPPPAALRAELVDARSRLARAGALRAGAKFAEGLALAREVGELDAASEWTPLRAAARQVEGDIAARMGDFDEAEPALAEAFEIATRAGDWRVAAAAATHSINAVGVGLRRPGEGRLWARFAELAIARAGDPSGTREAQRLLTLALLENADGKYPEAVALAERSVAAYEAGLGPEHPDVAAALSVLGNTLYALGDYPRVRELHTRALEIRRANLAPDHPDIAGSLNTLGAVAYATGDYETAAALDLEAIAMSERVFGPDHAEVARTLTNLGLVYRAQGELEEAEAVATRAVTIQEKQLGPAHPTLGSGLTNLAMIKSLRGDEEGAYLLQVRALSIYEEAHGPDHPLVATGLKNLAARHVQRGELETAHGLLTRALAIREKALGAEHPEVGSALVALAEIELDRRDPAAALKLGERAFAIYEAVDGEQPGENDAQWLLARALDAGGGDRERAVALAQRARAGAAGRVEIATAIDAWLGEHRAAR